MNRTDTLAIRTLLTMARQRLALDERQAAAVFALAAAGASSGPTLRRSLVGLQLSELQFNILVALFAAAPRPILPGDLAAYTGYRRSSVAGAVHDLLQRGYLESLPSTGNPRHFELGLTTSGRDLTDAAACRYLPELAQLARQLAPSPGPSPPAAGSGPISGSPTPHSLSR